MAPMDRPTIFTKGIDTSGYIQPQMLLFSVVVAEGQQVLTALWLS